jgi:protein-disulfide isomerase
MFKRLISAALLCTALSTSAFAAMTAEQKTEIGQIVREYLLANPEILREMSTELELKEKAAEAEARTTFLKENADKIYKQAIDPVIGNPKGDVTLVEFMDYNCSWCKKAVAELATLLEGDKNLKVVIKEFPIFGEGSEFAARAAMAATKQGKYWELHRALFESEAPVTEEVTLQLAEGLGIDIEKLKVDMSAQEITDSLAATQAMAIAMKINGTPAFMVDDRVFPGYVPAATLNGAVESVRENGGCKIC